MFVKVLRLLCDEASKLYVTGPRSDEKRRELRVLLEDALLVYDDYRRLSAREERIGG